MTAVVHASTLHARLLARARVSWNDTPHRHPAVDLDDLVVRGRAWAAHFDHFGHGADVWTRWRVAEISALMFATSPPSTVQLVNDFSMWIFALDNLAEAHRGTLAPLLVGLATNEGRGAFHEGWRALRVRIVEGQTREFSRRVDLEVERMLSVNTWEGTLRGAGHRPSDTLLERLRHFGGATYLYALLLEASVGGLDLGEVVSHRFQECTRLAGHLACLSNDLLNVAHDHRVDNPINLVSSHAREHNRTIDEARAVLERVLEERFATLVYLAADGHRSSDPRVRRYYAGLPCFVLGCLRWHMVTARYG
jgi:hypothetical protein